MSSKIAGIGVAASLAACLVGTDSSAQNLGSLGRGIFNCSASGNTQAGGAVIGGLLGGLAGAGVAKNDTVGALLGAAVGAAAGSWAGCKLQSRDQVSLEDATRRALEEGRSTEWTNPQTGASARINVLDDPSSYGARTQGRQYYSNAQHSDSRYGGPSGPIRIDRGMLAPRVALASSYEATPSGYTAISPTVIRTSPSLRAAASGRLAAGDPVEALAKVQGSSWILVGRNGRGIGYVPQSSVRATYGQSLASPIPVQSIRFDRGVRPAVGYETAAADEVIAVTEAFLRASPSLQATTIASVSRGDRFEAIAKVRNTNWTLVGRDGRGIGYLPDDVIDPAAGGYGYASTSDSCRIVEQVVSTREYGTETQRYRACRDQTGQWSLTNL